MYVITVYQPYHSIGVFVNLESIVIVNNTDASLWHAIIF